jgi:hypothetical protein
MRTGGFLDGDAVCLLSLSLSVCVCVCVCALNDL